MKHIISRLLTTIGLALASTGHFFLALGKRLDPPTPPPTPTKEIRLHRRAYRVVGREPGRWEVFRLGLGILFGSLRFGLVGI